MNSPREMPTRPEIERALRDAGMSLKQAKRLLSGGWKLCVSEEQFALDELAELKERLLEALEKKA